MKSRILSKALSVSLMLLGGVGVASAAGGKLDGNEWASWRGPENNGVSRAKGLVSSWKTEDENLLWKSEFGGRSAPIVFGGRVYYLRLTGKDATRQEQLVCLDADTGKLLWDHKMDLFLSDIPEERVGWTAPVGDPETGYIYINGAQGFFKCFDKDGKVVWEHSLGEEFGKISGFGGRTFTPVLDGDLVVVGFNNSGLGDQGKPMNRLLAMDKKSGEVRWWYTPVNPVLDTNYSCPSPALVNGQRLLIGGGGDGYIRAVKAETGERVWDFKMGPGPVNVTPLIMGDKVYVAYSEENITGRVVCIDATGTSDVSKTHLVWEIEKAVGYSSMTTDGKNIFFVENNGTMHGVDAATGKELWKKKVGKVSKCSPVYADGKIYYASTNGDFLILEPGEKDCKVLSKQSFTAADGFGIDLTGSPAVAYGRVYFMTRDFMYCLGEKGKKPAPISIDPLPSAGKGEGEPAWVQVLPADVQIAKSGKAKFTARTFDAKGRLIGEAKSEWALFEDKLKGTLSADGEYAPDASVVAQFGLIEAKVGNLKGYARVRVKPDLPINTDFEKIPEGLSPVSWVGATKVKFNVVAEDGNKFLKKTADARILNSNIFITEPHTSGYTIQADVRGGLNEHATLPNIGLINSRYVFDLMGATQQLRIIGWVPRPSRVTKTLDFKWEPKVWYTLKCRVDYEGDKGIVRGKVWKKGEEEPKAWSLEMEDPLPYREGAPGLTCYPIGEASFDNVKVEKN